MSETIAQVKRWLEELVILVNDGEDPSSRCYAYFSQEPELGVELVKIIASLDEKEMDDERTYYSACIFALDVCVSQLQSAVENGNKLAGNPKRIL